MLPQRIARTSMRRCLAASRQAPIAQRRAYLPSHYADKKTLDEKYPDAPQMSAAEDPEMVRTRNPAVHETETYPNNPSFRNRRIDKHESTALLTFVFLL